MAFSNILTFVFIFVSIFHASHSFFYFFICLNDASLLPLYVCDFKSIRVFERKILKKPNSSQRTKCGRKIILHEWWFVHWADWRYEKRKKWLKKIWSEHWKIGWMNGIQFNFNNSIFEQNQQTAESGFLFSFFVTNHNNWLKWRKKSDKFQGFFRLLYPVAHPCIAIEKRWRVREKKIEATNIDLSAKSLVFLILYAKAASKYQLSTRIFFKSFFASKNFLCNS